MIPFVVTGIAETVSFSAREAEAVIRFQAAAVVEASAITTTNHIPSMEVEIGQGALEFQFPSWTLAYHFAEVVCQFVFRNYPLLAQVSVACELDGFTVAKNRQSDALSHAVAEWNGSSRTSVS